MNPGPRVSPALGAPKVHHAPRSANPPILMASGARDDRPGYTTPPLDKFLVSDELISFTTLCHSAKRSEVNLNEDQRSNINTRNQRENGKG